MNEDANEKKLGDDEAEKVVDEFMKTNAVGDYIIPRGAECFKCGVEVSKNQWNDDTKQFECHLHIPKPKQSGVQALGPQPMTSKDFGRKKR